MKRKYFILLILLIVVGGAYYNISHKNENGRFEKNTAGAISVAIKEGVVYAGNQKASLSVVIDLAILSAEGFVAIYEENQNGERGELSGVSVFLPAGLNQKIPVKISRQSMQKNYLTAVLYADNGDGQFNPSQDKLVKDKNGEVIKAYFHLHENGGGEED